MPIVLEGSVLLAQPGADQKTARVSRCQVVNYFEVNTYPNATAIRTRFACYTDRAAFDAGKNPMDGGAGIEYALAGEMINELFDDPSQVTLQQFVDHLTTMPQFNYKPDDA